MCEAFKFFSFEDVRKEMLLFVLYWIQFCFGQMVPTISDTYSVNIISVTIQNGVNTTLLYSQYLNTPKSQMTNSGNVEGFQGNSTIIFDGPNTIQIAPFFDRITCVKIPQQNIIQGFQIPQYSIL